MGNGEYQLDGRTAEDIKKEIADLAKSYTPEWKFDTQNPDIGSVLSLLFAEYMEDGIEKFNCLLEQFRMEFVNMLGINLLPVHPAEALVVFHPPQGGTGETWLPKGTRLSAAGEEKNIQFRTVQGCFLTHSRLTHCFQAEGGTGVLLPVFGNFPRAGYSGEDGQAGTEFFHGTELFAFPERGIENYALLLKHEQIFDINNDRIYMKFPGAKDLAERIFHGEFRVLYPSSQGIQKAEGLELQEEVLVIKRKEPVLPVLVIEAVHAPKTSIVFQEIFVSSQGKSSKKVYAGNGNLDFDVDKFCPFGDKLQLFEECYIGDDSCFSKKNARIVLTFDVTFLERTADHSSNQPEEDLRVVKRKPPRKVKQRLAQTKVEELSFEYFNGTGWKRLILEQDCSRMFASARPGTYEICFRCPPDWKIAQSGSFQGRCIRMRLMKADDCYLLPCVHSYPVLEHLEISFSYQGNYERPQNLELFYENGRVDLTKEWNEKRKVPVLPPPRHEKHTLYLGFDKKLEHGPVNLYFEFAPHTGFLGTKLSFEYSGTRGFCKMQVLDGTKGFRHTGIIQVAGPKDFTQREELGVKRYWIRIREEHTRRGRPFLKQVSLNGVMVQNIEVLEEEEFYIDGSRSNMACVLSDRYIVDADIWVNEKNSCSADQMQEMLENCPGQVRAEYDLMGNIQDFYVKWTETENFDDSHSGDRHYILDRARGQVQFGDGVHVKIPEVTDSAAFLAAVRVSDGEEGNVPAGTIREFVSNTEFQGEVSNPLPAFGGTDQESAKRAADRGAVWFGSRGRLLSRADFVRELKGYSENIAKVSVITGQGPEGTKEPDHICLVVLMKDFAEGSRTFQQEAERMKEFLCSKCDMAVPKDKLSVVSPVPVEISVELWAEVPGKEERFEIQNNLIQLLNRYLNPVGESEFQEGWEIGILPRESQILMRLHGASGRIRIRHVMVTGRYRHRGTVYERELDEIPKSPFFVCKSGQHKVHILS